MRSSAVAATLCAGMVVWLQRHRFVTTLIRATTGTNVVTVNGYRNSSTVPRGGS